MKAQTTKEVLIATKYILEKVGWHQGSYYKLDGMDAYGVENEHLADLQGACLVGAMFLVEAAPEDKASATSALARILCEDGAPFACLPIWNDTVGRTKEEVLALLDQAIENEGAK